MHEFDWESDGSRDTVLTIDTEMSREEKESIQASIDRCRTAEEQKKLKAELQKRFGDKMTFSMKESKSEAVSLTLQHEREKTSVLKKGSAEKTDESGKEKGRKDKSRIMAFSTDGDNEDAMSESLNISATLSYSQRRKIREMTARMKELDREIDRAQEVNDPARISGALNQWENTRDNIIHYVKSCDKKAQINHLPRKDYSHEMEKGKRSYREQHNIEHAAPKVRIRVHRRTHSKEKGMERTLEKKQEE